MLARPALLAAPLDPPMPARADAVEVIAARLGTVAIEVDADQPAVAAPDAARIAVREGREVGLLDGRGRHARAIYHAAGCAAARRRKASRSSLEMSAWLDILPPRGRPRAGCAPRSSPQRTSR